MTSFELAILRGYEFIYFKGDLSIYIFFVFMAIIETFSHQHARVGSFAIISIIKCFGTLNSFFSCKLIMS